MSRDCRDRPFFTISIVHLGSGQWRSVGSGRSVSTFYGLFALAPFCFAEGREGPTLSFGNYPIFGIDLAGCSATREDLVDLLFRNANSIFIRLLLDILHCVFFGGDDEVGNCSTNPWTESQMFPDDLYLVLMTFRSGMILFNLV